MNRQKSLKFILPSLLMSALVFACMPGSVRFYGASATETALNFFNAKDLPSAGWLSTAAMLTAVTMVISFIPVFSKKHQPFQVIYWLSLLSAGLTAMPYVTPTEEGILQPNVIITILLMACWLIALYLHKNQEKEGDAAPAKSRL